jgi:hypothetical protein
MHFQIGLVNYLCTPINPRSDYKMILLSCIKCHGPPNKKKCWTLVWHIRLFSWICCFLSFVCSGPYKRAHFFRHISLITLDFFYFDDNLQFIPFSWPKLLQEGHSFYLHPNLTCGIWNILSWAGVNLWISVCMKYTMDWRAVGVGYFSYFAELVHFSPFLPKQCGLDDVESHQGKFLPLFCHKFIWKLK